MIRAALLTLGVFALLAAGCGSDNDSNANRPASEDQAMKAKEEKAMKAKEEKAMKAKAKGTAVKVVNSRFGQILADRKGQAFYLFDKEKTKKAECYGACAKAWPPVLTKGKPRAGKGAQSSLLGTTKRRDGKLQVTYAGKPMYYYVDDSPGKVLCHNVDEFGGLWLVLRANGKPAPS